MQSAGIGGRAGVLNTQFTDAVYELGPTGDLVFIASDVPIDTLIQDGLVRGQVLVIDLLWSPRAGSTPMDASATNASIRHAIAIDGQLGHYAGAGFLNIRGTPGDGPVSIGVADSSLRLVAASERFSDPLSPTRLTARIGAREDAGAVSRIRSLLRSTEPAAVVAPEPPAPLPPVAGPPPASG